MNIVIIYVIIVNIDNYFHLSDNKCIYLFKQIFDHAK
jgi:hypothetical protein